MSKNPVELNIDKINFTISAFQSNPQIPILYGSIRAAFRNISTKE